MKPVRFVRTGRTVIAIQRFAGKDIKASATCDPADDFDFEVGKKLAELRLNEKIAKKRYQLALERQHSCYNEWEKICKRLTFFTDRVSDRLAELHASEVAYDLMIDNLQKDS